MTSGRSFEHLRFAASQSRGRRYPELPHPYRNEFQRDRDRIIHSRAFRRLEDKTQVFTPGLSDHFRNRLTHTLEVTQISRTVAAVLGLNEDLTEALALAHDIGHPPFAHSGEDELDRQMQRYGERFDHNLHSLRIVETFELKYARFPGLNLTFEVREGMVKHSSDFESGENPELDEYLPGKRPLLEAQIIDLADEVAYNAADLDDGFAASMFTADEIEAEVPGYGDLLDTVRTQFAGASDRVQFAETLRMLIDMLVSGLIAGTAAAVEKADVDSAEAVREYPGRLVQFEGQAGATNAALKQFLRKHVYYSTPLAEERTRNARAVGELFQFFMENPRLLPEAAEDTAEPLHRTVCDYLAAMTDGYFRRVFAQRLGQPSAV